MKDEINKYVKKNDEFIKKFNNLIEEKKQNLDEFLIIEEMKNVKNLTIFAQNSIDEMSNSLIKIDDDFHKQRLELLKKIENKENNPFYEKQLKLINNQAVIHINTIESMLEEYLKHLKEILINK